jgi:hypothetical protein
MPWQWRRKWPKGHTNRRKSSAIKTTPKTEQLQLQANAAQSSGQQLDPARFQTTPPACHRAS